MHVKIQKSVFESYTIEGDLLEVTQVIEQLGFSPEQHVREYFTDAEALEAVSSDQLKPKPTGPDWQEIDQRDLCPGDIIRVQLRCNTEYSPERIVTAFPASNTRVMANTLEEGIESPVSSSDIYSSIQVDMNSRIERKIR